MALPAREDRREIIELYSQRYLKTAPDPDQVARLVDLSDGFAGSDLESTLHDVGEEAYRCGGADRLKPSFLLDAFANTVPLSRVNPEQIEEIRAWGRERAVPAGRSAMTAAQGNTGPARRIVFMDE